MEAGGGGQKGTQTSEDEWEEEGGKNTYINRDSAGMRSRSAG